MCIYGHVYGYIYGQIEINSEIFGHFRDEGAHTVRTDMIWTKKTKLLQIWGFRVFIKLK
jgi:hypothetical protein